LAHQLESWDGDIGPKSASLPLRLAGGLHALVLRKCPISAWPPPPSRQRHRAESCNKAGVSCNIKYFFNGSIMRIKQIKSPEAQH
jgi:hypothetical protein